VEERVFRYGSGEDRVGRDGVAPMAAEAHVTLTKDKSCDKRVTVEGDKLRRAGSPDLPRTPSTRSFGLINIIFGPIRAVRAAAPRVII